VRRPDVTVRFWDGADGTIVIRFEGDEVTDKEFWKGERPFPRPGLVNRLRRWLGL
jgi:hypothetical protein